MNGIATVLWTARRVVSGRLHLNRVSVGVNDLANRNISLSLSQSRDTTRVVQIISEGCMSVRLLTKRLLDTRSVDLSIDIDKISSVAEIKFPIALCATTLATVPCVVLFVLHVNLLVQLIEKQNHDRSNHQGKTKHEIDN